MLVRMASELDGLKVSRLWACMAREDDPKLEPDLSMWRGYVSALMKSPAYCMFLAEEGGKVLGFIDYAIRPEPGFGIWQGVFNHFYVLPEYRNTKVSGSLWRTAIKNARSKGIKEMTAACFPKMTGFWQKHGFALECHTLWRKIA